MTQKKNPAINTIASCFPPRRKSALSDFEPTLTKQAFKDDCDVNLIMKRFAQTGVIDHVNAAAPAYEFAPSLDFREALELIQNAEKSFDDLPAEIRKKFDNNPAEFLAFTEDENNLPEMAAMGLTSDSYIPASENSKNPANDELDTSNDDHPPKD